MKVLGRILVLASVMVVMSAPALAGDPPTGTGQTDTGSCARPASNKDKGSQAARGSDSGQKPSTSGTAK